MGWTYKLNRDNKSAISILLIILFSMIKQSMLKWIGILSRKSSNATWSLLHMCLHKVNLQILLPKYYAVQILKELYEVGNGKHLFSSLRESVKNRNILGKKSFFNGCFFK